ncbi:MAG TPA: hypothetical protein VIK26_07535 [Clostridium sp.]
MNRTKDTKTNKNIEQIKSINNFNSLKKPLVNTENINIINNSKKGNDSLI